MQVLVWLFRFAIVLVLVWFAVKNAQPVTLHGLPDQTWQAPLVFVLLVVFIAGVVIGLLAWLPTVVRQRREMARLRKANDVLSLGAANPPPADPPRVDVHGI
ncbi:Lipopolysaccharide assembly protein A [Usitatibacter rugosus]|uniref:Lipopolysaccharide assembly protein A n=1 Tax=Usitatibacter rugosus TaxID=2732067 RepID=A0A6M4GX36_9PROT|nr:LapA family protein [Usitatibacter rugosus]QJR11555.1 Lipopolysaccharide assembly protein A [Usitatibacter rugosus]